MSNEIMRPLDNVDLSWIVAQVVKKPTLMQYTRAKRYIKKKRGCWNKKYYYVNMHFPQVNLKSEYFS